MRHPSTRVHPSDTGGAAAGFIAAILILVALAVAAFFYFGGEADVDIKQPDVKITSDETPE